MVEWAGDHFGLGLTEGRTDGQTDRRCATLNAAP